MANKHMPYDLAQMQSIPLEGKIIMTQQRIRQWHEYWDGMVYVSFSGEMVDGKWQPSKEGLGLGYVLDYINVEY